MEELLELYDNVMESCECDPMGMNNRIVIESSIDNIKSEDLESPQMVKSVKKQLKSIKNWKKLLKIISRLTAIGAGAGTAVALGKGVQADALRHEAALATKNANSSFRGDGGDVQKLFYGRLDTDEISSKFGKSSEYATTAKSKTDLANASDSIAKVSAIASIIAAAISILTALAKKMITDKQFDQLPALSAELDRAIKDSEAKLSTTKNENALQRNIEQLKILKDMVDNEIKDISN